MRHSHPAGIFRTLLILAALITFPACAIQATTEEDVGIRRLDEGVWLHTSYMRYPDGTRVPSNGLVVKTGPALTLIDTAWGERSTLRLLDIIATEIRLPVTRAMVTHAHDDRMSGVGILKARGVEVWSHPVTQGLARAKALPAPDKAFETISVPGDATEFAGMEVLYPGHAHAPDNLVVWLPGKEILFAGCAVRSRTARSAGNTSDSDPGSWLRALDLIGTRYASANTVVPGHGEPGGHELIGHTAWLVRLDGAL